MIIKLKKYSALIFFLFVTSNCVYATPIVSFNGTFGYTVASNSNPGILSVTGTLIGYQDLSFTPVLSGSQFNLTTVLQEENYTATTSQGLFGTSGGVWDFNLTNGDGTDLLYGTVGSLSMSGQNGFTFGLLSGNTTSMGGTLLSDFSNPFTLLGLQLDMSVPFSQNMFQNNFTGVVNASLRAMPDAVTEPSGFILFAAGLFGMLFVKRKN